MFSICCIGGALGGETCFRLISPISSLLAQLSKESFLQQCMVIRLSISFNFRSSNIGGIKSIAKVTEKLVPLMATIYIFCALIIIFINLDMVGNAINLIFIGAFTGEGIAGGLIGVLIQGLRGQLFPMKQV